MIREEYSVNQEIQLVVFKLRQSDSLCEYAVPITQVQEIIRNSKATRLPESPDFLEGIISLRGKVIPIINLKKRFNLDFENDDDSCSVLVEIGGGTVGIMVDEVSEVLQMPVGKIEKPPAAVQNVSAEYLVGIGKVNDRLLLLLDVSKIFSEPEKEKIMGYINNNA